MKQQMLATRRRVLPVVANVPISVVVQTGINIRWAFVKITLIVLLGSWSVFSYY
jgi:hypothetical protein